MGWTYHEGNENRRAVDLLTEAIDEVHEMIDRQNKGRYAPIRMTVPPQPYDSDVLLLDAMHRAIEELSRD